MGSVGPLSPTDLTSAVHTHYTAASTSRTKSGHYETTVAHAFGYSPEELSHIPSDANLGLSCGNPFALAALREGETVVDLGSGAGFDIFLASKKVGSSGHAIGVDVNKSMLAKANKNRADAIARGDDGVQNVSFVESQITSMPAIESATVDCVISNCVINLVPEGEKHAVFEEMYRVLKPGGRVAVSDVLLKEDLPQDLKNDVALYVGCISGASRVEGYERYLKEAGFKEILIVDNKKDLNVYDQDVAEGSEGKSCCGTTTQSSCGGGGNTEKKKAEVNANRNGVVQSTVDLKKVDFNRYAGSYNVYAVKA